MLHDFLFEIGTEELPSGVVLSLSEALATNLLTALKKSKIGFGSVKSFATPRRLAVLIHELEPASAPEQVIQRGPALSIAYDESGLPTKALQGFAKSLGVPIDKLTTETSDKGSWVVYDKVFEGIETKDLMPSLVKEAVLALPLKKPMRWGEGEIEFVRPVHWLLMLLDEEVLSVDLLGQTSGKLSFGHRFHAPEAMEIINPLAYEKQLEKAFVIADFARRRTIIKAQIEAASRAKHAIPLIPDTLLDEVTSIVEWPETQVVSFDQNFLALPQEVLIASMQQHQKCFALQDDKGKLMPFFATVTNLQSALPSQVIKGNEKVMRARLSDADFFFCQDKKNPLSTLIPRTGNVIFQAKLGTLFDKSTRLQRWMANLSTAWVFDQKKGLRAAQLCKCDLMTGMVGEFPELQGLMGYYYALHDGEGSEVAEAIREHYLPRFSADELPSTVLGTALSLADRLDTLIGIFGLSQKPTGDKDPFKLRRHALAVARLLIHNPNTQSLSQLIQQGLDAYQDQLPSEAAAAIATLHPFIFERLQSYYQALGIAASLFQAVRVCQSECLFDFDKRIRALADFIPLPAAQSLASACKRVTNILRQEKDPETIEIDSALLVDPAEQALFNSLLGVEAEVAPHYQQADYVSILKHLAQLKEPVDNFFDNVMVMVDSPLLKNNRLALLVRLKHLLQGTADFSLLSSVSS